MKLLWGLIYVCFFCWTIGIVIHAGLELVICLTRKPYDQ